MNISQLKKPAKIRESALAAVIMLAICYMAYTNFYSPNQVKAKNMDEEMQKIEEKITGVEKLISALKKKQDLQKKAMSDQERAKKDPRLQMIQKYKAPVYENISQLLNAVTDYKFRSNLNIQSLKYANPVQSEGYKYTQFQLEASGRFTKLVEFVKKLENVQALVSLDAVNIQIAKSDSNQVSMDLSATFYELEAEDAF